jgi:hypothetical protein
MEANLEWYAWFYVSPPRKNCGQGRLFLNNVWSYFFVLSIYPSLLENSRQNKERKRMVPKPIRGEPIPSSRFWA